MAKEAKTFASTKSYSPNPKPTTNITAAKHDQDGHSKKGDQEGENLKRFGFVILVLQAGLLLLALILGWFGHIPWWHNYHADLPALAAAVIFGAVVSGAMNGIYWYLLCRGNTNIRYIIEDLVIPISCGLHWPYRILIIGIIPALCEEALFRGTIQPQLIDWFGVAPGLIATALLFGSLHIGNRRTIPMGVFAAVLGLALGYVYHITSNLALASAIHATINLVSVAALPLYIRKLLTLPVIAHTID